MRTSESVSEPASSHWSLWNVTVRIVSEEEPVEHGLGEHALAWRRRAARRARDSSRDLLDERGHLLDTRAPREPILVALRELDGGSPPFANRACMSTSAARIPSTSSGATTTPAPVSRTSVRGRAVGRHDREDRTAGRDVLEDLPGENALPTAARVGDEEEQRFGVALQAQRLATGRVRHELEAVAEVERLRPFAIRRAGNRRRSARRRRDSPA